jgi:hypothetical protein
MRQRGRHRRAAKRKTPPNLPLKGRLNDALVFIVDIIYF